MVERPWESVTMDFITSLPMFDGYGKIGVVVDRFSKYDTFMTSTSKCTTKKAARLLFNKMLKNWGLRRHIIRDHDSLFTGNLWRELFNVYDTKNHFFTSFHP